MLPATLVVGSTGSAREQWIAQRIHAVSDARPVAALLEGLSTGHPILESLPQVQVTRIAPGCVCCANQMVMRTYLHRVIRARPAHLYLSLANPTHLAQIRQSLQSTDYAQHLTLSEIIELA